MEQFDLGDLFSSAAQIIQTGLSRSITLTDPITLQNAPMRSSNIAQWHWHC